MAICTICIDTGTTNTRVWLVCGERIISRAGAMVGVRDTARDGSSARLRATLRDLIAEVSAHPESREPAFVAAAGMITSSLGLVEVPHLTAPAGRTELAAHVRRCDFPDVTHLPVLLVPGVRTGPQAADLMTVNSVDLMRGEETMCVGLLAAGLATAPCTVINLGSHWKVITIDADGRIAGSVTSLAGEMIHATQTQTILASAVPQTRPEFLNPHWIEAGMREQRESGLARAMFCVRLLEQGRRSTPEERLAFLIGAFIASDLDPLMARNALVEPTIIAGGGPIAEAWRRALSSIDPRVLANEEIERALLAGLRSLTRDR
jgi:2-dehydro-3-deoxygalactonokinase